MICPRCGEESPSGGDMRFCMHCGEPLAAEEDPTQEPLPGEEAAGPAVEPQTGTTGQDRLQSLETNVRMVLAQQTRLGQRLSAIERLVGLPPGGQPARPRPPPAPASSSEAPPSSQPGAPGVLTPALEGGGAPLQPPGPSLWDTVAGWNWEQILGKNWFAIIGALTLAIGMGFFLKLAFDNDWIGPIGRITLGIAAGMAMLGAGEYSQRRVPLWAQPVTAGGIGILYLSIYAAFGRYELIDPLLAFLFLGLVVVLSVLLALRYESMVIALLGIVGAFLTPLLLGRDLDNPKLVLLYILVIDVGVLGVSTFRNWRWFTLVGLLGSYGLFALWLEQFTVRDPVLVELALAGVFLLFVGATTMFHILWRRMPGPADMALMTINAAGFYALTFDILWADYEIWFGLISLSLSLLYAGVAFAAIKRSGTPPQVALFALSTAVVFLTVAVPLQLSGSWVSVAWAAEGAVIIWVGFLLGRWPMRAFGLGVLTVALFRLLIFDTWVDLEGFKPVLNDRFPTFAAAIAAFYVASYLYWRERDHLQVWETYVGPALAGLANFITLWLFTAEVIAYFDSRVMPFQPTSQEAAGAGFPVWRLASQAAENGKFLTLTAMWTIYAFGALVIGLAKRSAPLRWAGLGLLAVPALKLLLFDTFMVKLDPLTFLPVLNFHFLVFFIVLAALLAAAFLYRRERERLTGQEGYVFLVLLVVANVVALWVLSAEAVRFFESQEAKRGVDYFSAMHLTLTVLWAVYAVGVIAFGIVRQSSRIRLAGMALLAIPVVKLFAFDIFLLERGYRVAAFITLGAMLLGTGLVYQRYSQAIRGFLFGQRA
ncbi:MAG: DUF2339 domain-containing protein [Chloroflexi bacterium]|nr:DUF2339 domain-containing protein [Chloroflexota bacterium]